MRPITERMVDSLHKLNAHWSGKRRPKAFYLAPDDWDAFRATDPPMGRFPFGNNPPTMVDDPVFEGVPVRVSESATSRLYDHTKTGRALPE